MKTVQHRCLQCWSCKVKPHLLPPFFSLCSDEPQHQKEHLQGLSNCKNLVFFLVNYPRYRETPISPARTTCACREHYKMTLQSDNSVFLWLTLFYLVVFPDFLWKSLPCFLGGFTLSFQNYTTSKRLLLCRERKPFFPPLW